MPSRLNESGATQVGVKGNLRGDLDREGLGFQVDV